MPRLNSLVRQQRSSDAGFTLLELLVAMGLMTVVMAVTLGGLSDATKANEAVMNLTSMNNSIRIGMDMMVRDLLQVGSGLPPSHVVLIPSGASSSLVKIPGPPGTALTLPAGTYTLWTMPHPTSVDVIVNKETGQWGTQYNRALDVGRAPLKVDSATAPVEKFTISIVPNDKKGGALVMEWGAFRWTAPIVVS